MKFIKQGFTLIELLVVIAIVVALSVAVFVALNPGQRLQDARDARRVSDVDSILTAVHEYIVDNAGSSPSGLSTTEQQLGTGATGCAISTGGCSVTATACLDLSTALAAYLKTIPVDPLGGTTHTAANTGYSVEQDANGLVTVRACGSEGSTNIEASR